VEKAVAETDKEDVLRWTTKRKATIVLSMIKGETSIQEAARQGGLKQMVVAFADRGDAREYYHAVFGCLIVSSFRVLEGIPDERRRAVHAIQLASLS
jgi:hypothetical protein